MSKVLDTKDKLLDAALKVIAAEGAAQLTLERVAQEAGVSKGGLLYHFRSKDALVAGLLDRFVTSYEAQVQTDAAPGGWARANLHVTVSTSGDEAQAADALMAAAVTNPALLGRVREAWGRWQRGAEADGLEPGMGTLLRLALDGWWYARTFGLPVPEGVEREAFEALYTRLVEQGDG